MTRTMPLPGTRRARGRKAAGAALAAALITLTLGAAPGAAQAQGIHITPLAGIYVPGSEWREIQSGAERVRVERDGSLALGLNLELGSLRGSLGYVTGGRISEEGVAGDIGDGSLLTAALDLVIRPLPRLLVQPYLFAGPGLVREQYSFDAGRFSGFPRDESHFALHLGAGADLMLGRLGVAAELSDWISRPDDGGTQHDVFIMVGLRVRL
jgi:hypothetical protein